MATMTNVMTPSCRFCYSYKPPGMISTTCSPITMPNLSTISTQTILTNNSGQTNSSTLLRTIALQNQTQNQSTILSSTIQATLANSAIITSTLQGQLVQLQSQRYVPYQPYIPPVIPSSVTDLQMRTANVGNPMPPISMRACRGVQSVTRQAIYNDPNKNKYIFVMFYYFIIFYGFTYGRERRPSS